MIFKNANLTPQQFLADYWQQKPLLIRQALPGFTPELDADDIAGLACDELAESRLVTGSFPEHDWQLRYGPFKEEEFVEFPDSNWTLLVQDVEKHYPPLQGLMQEFSFLPRWRIDDLMISVAGPGGSVGPHIDQYDVFLLQAQGSRRWQIAESFDDKLLPDSELNVLQRFQAEQEWVLEPGDLLYLPHGQYHDAVAESGESLHRSQAKSTNACSPATMYRPNQTGIWALADIHQPVSAAPFAPLQTAGPHLLDDPSVNKWTANGD